MTKKQSRYIVVRMVKDTKVPHRYQRSGWKAFDTLHKTHGQVWSSKREAEIEALLLSGLLERRHDDM